MGTVSLRSIMIKIGSTKMMTRSQRVRYLRRTNYILIAVTAVGLYTLLHTIVIMSFWSVILSALSVVVAQVAHEMLRNQIDDFKLRTRR